MSVLSENIDYNAIVGETYLVMVRIDRHNVSKVFKADVIAHYRDIKCASKRSDVADVLSAVMFDKLISAPNAIIDEIGLNSLFGEFGDLSFVETTDICNDWRSREFHQRIFNADQTVHIILTPRDNVSFTRRS